MNLAAVEACVSGVVPGALFEGSAWSLFEGLALGWAKAMAASADVEVEGLSSEEA